MATITVTTLADTIAIDGLVSLREALNAANADTTVDGVTGAGDDIIVFDASLAGGTSLLLGGQLLITSNVTINGDTNGDGKADITLSGGDLTRILDVVVGTVTLESLNFSDGSFLPGGGGAIQVELAATVNLVNSTVSSSTASDGGAIASFGTLNVANSTFTGNTAATGGGAIAVLTGATSVVNSTITGNTAGSLGGGIFASSGAVTVSSSTITGNTAVVTGGGIFTVTPLALTNSVVSANHAPVPGDANIDGLALGSNNLTGAGDAVIGGGNIISDIPLLGPLADNGGPVMTMLPQLGSLAINTGNPALLPLDTLDLDGDNNFAEPLPVDARGQPRIVGALDIGAVERANAPPTGTDTTVTTAEDTPYVFAIADFGFSDSDGNALLAVNIATLPASGVLKLNGVALAAPTSVNAALITAGLLTYEPAANVNGAAAASFDFTVQDSGAGTDTSAASTITVDVSAVNDAPSLALANALTSLTEAASTAAAIKVAGIDIVDDGQGTNILSLSGADAALFEISGGDLYLKAGAVLDFETNPVLDVTVSLDDAGVGATPDGTVALAIMVTDAAETITGNKKSNVLVGTAASEIINGKGGSDTIRAGGGNDTIIGGGGADTVAGGTGADVFVFKPGHLPKPSTAEKLFGGLFGRYDLIRDFKPGTDVIDLSALDANSKKAGNQAFHFEGRDQLSHSRGELVYEFYGSKPSARHTIILGDTDGNGEFDFRIVLKGHHHLEASDFIL